MSKKEKTNPSTAPAASDLNGGSRFSQQLRKTSKRYFIDGMGALAFGLFASLIVGTILKTFFSFIDIPWMQPYFQQIIHWTGAGSPLIGAALGVAVAFGLKSKPLVMYSCAVVGGMAYMMNSIDVFTGDKTGLVSAGPVGVFIAVVIAAELGTLVFDKTPVNILVVPIVTLISGTVAAVLVGPPIADFMGWLGQVVIRATDLYPLWMGMAVGVIVGMALTAPISSAALCMMLGLTGLAAGAATAGGCAQMIGFAVISYRENKLNGLVTQGLGTSMVQMPNIFRKPILWIPPTIASAITGALSATVFRMTNNPQGAGMGTAGFVGQITTWNDMTTPVDGSVGENGWIVVLYIVLLHYILPAAISLCGAWFMRKKGWIKDGDMLLVK